MQAWYVGTHGPAMRPMGLAGLATIGISYVAILTLYAAIVITASRALGYHFI